MSPPIQEQIDQFPHLLLVLILDQSMSFPLPPLRSVPKNWKKINMFFLINFNNI